MEAVDSHSKWNRLIAAFVFLTILSCYLITISPTVSFWDSGEFIATSYILGVPHPPGTPFYVIIGRLFSMLPFKERALGVNLMSAVGGALACLFLYLITVRVLVLWRGVPQRTIDKLITYASAASAAFAGAFSGSYWINSIEAEVYSPSAFIMAFATWLMVRWSQRWREPGSRNSLILICYLLSLSVGLHLGTVLVLPAFVIFALLIDWRLFTDVKFLVLVVFVGVIGLSNHLYLPIRSHLNPPIDEANPERWDAFRDCLLRKQYKPMNPFIRQASWSFQFGMFWRYFEEQWTGPGGSWTVLLIPLGALGSIIHFFKHRRTFILIGTIFLITSLGLIIYMNFTDHEVRERDYFFAHGFFFFSLWIGVAIAYLSDRVLAQHKGSGIVYAVPLLLLVFTFSSYYVNFESHDRRGDYNAHDYAYNMLATVAEDGIIFTNGDNDTFPLWFIQEVKGFRKDVRVVNLSLLNTPWYIWQLKHLEPKVPIRFSDGQIAQLRPFRDRSGKIVLVKDVAAKEIIEATGDRKPIYFAVTVADFMGYEKRLRLEGLAFRLVSEETRETVDVEKTLYNLYNVYSYRGLLKPAEGEYPEPPLLTDVGERAIPREINIDRKVVYDTEVYKNENTRRLVTNYAAAHLRLCLYYFESGDYGNAVRELEQARLISPDYRGYRDLAVVVYGYAGNTTKAESLANEFIFDEPENVTYYVQLFNIYRRVNRLEDAEKVLTNLIEILPNNPDGYSLLTSFYREMGKADKAAGVVRKWLKRHPGDRTAMKLLDQLTAEAESQKP